METSNLANEYAQINKIVQVYNKNLIKRSFLLANLSKSEFPKLINIPIFHNIYGLKELPNSKRQFLLQQHSMK